MKNLLKTPISKKIEYIADKSIPYLIVLLLAIVIIEIFFKETAHQYHSQIYVLDSIIVAIFVVDIVFKYNKVRSIPKFLKSYWLDVLAVFPFLMLFRLVEEIVIISESIVSVSKNMLHIGVALEEEIAAEAKLARAARTSELVAKEGRLALVTKWFRPLRRLPRLLKGISFYEHPHYKRK